jgi:hypothetical protein
LATAAFIVLFIAPMPATCQQTPAPAAQSTAKDAKSAQPLKRLADGHPDLNGFWLSSAGPDTPVGGFDGPLGNGPGRRGGDNGAKARAADPNQPPYKPELLDKVKDLARNESKTDPAFYCKPGGVPRIGPPHAIIQAPGMPIVFLYQVIAGNTFRLVPMDGRPHDPESDDTYYGDSIGRWDGDTLVVDTVHLNDDTWLGLDGQCHARDRAHQPRGEYPSLSGDGRRPKRVYASLGDESSNIAVNDAVDRRKFPVHRERRVSHCRFRTENDPSTMNKSRFNRFKPRGR